MNKHLVIISILSFFFITLLLVASNQNGISKEIQLNSDFSLNTTQQKIGEITFSNSGILPKRVHLNSYIACDFQEEKTSTYNIGFKGNIDYVYDEFLEYTHYLDISSKGIEKVELYLEMYPKYYYQEEFEYIENLYIFENENSLKYYYQNPCSSLNKEDALKIISSSNEN